MGLIHNMRFSNWSPDSIYFDADSILKWHDGINLKYKTHLNVLQQVHTTPSAAMSVSELSRTCVAMRVQLQPRAATKHTPHTLALQFTHSTISGGQLASKFKAWSQQESSVSLDHILYWYPLPKINLCWPVIILCYKFLIYERSS